MLQSIEGGDVEAIIFKSQFYHQFLLHKFSYVSSAFDQDTISTLKGRGRQLLGMKYQLDNMQEIVLNHGKCQLDIAPDSFEMAESTVSDETPCY